MDLVKLRDHVKLCLRNLKSQKVKCCARCPFEEEITGQYPELAELFKKKQTSLGLNKSMCYCCGRLVSNPFKCKCKKLGKR